VEQTDLKVVAAAVAARGAVEGQKGEEGVDLSLESEWVAERLRGVHSQRKIH
jgi:hypothetical protein